MACLVEAFDCRGLLPVYTPSLMIFSMKRSIQIFSLLGQVARMPDIWLPLFFEESVPISIPSLPLAIEITYTISLALHFLPVGRPCDETKPIDIIENPWLLRSLDWHRNMSPSFWMFLTNLKLRRPKINCNQPRIKHWWNASTLRPTHLDFNFASHSTEDGSSLSWQFVHPSISWVVDIDIS